MGLSAMQPAFPSHLDGVLPAEASSPRRYHPVAVVLHWATAVVIGGAMAVVILSDAASGISFKLALTNAHFVLGCLVLLLSAVRVAWRLRAAAPERGDSSAARRVHFLLYALMFVVPAAGLCATFLYGRNIAFGLFEIASPLAADREKAKILGDLHALLAWGFMTLCLDTS